MKKAQLLNVEDQMLMKRMISGYERVGALLPTSKQEILQTLETRLAKITMDIWQKSEHKSRYVLLTKKDLSGLPEKFFANRQIKRVGTKLEYELSALGPDVKAVLQYASLENTRKCVYMASCLIDTDDMKLLEEVVDLRRVRAIYLGHSSHAEYVFEDMAVGTPREMLDFLQGLYHQLSPVAQRELDQLKELKQTHMEFLGKTFDGFYEWDIPYYKQIFLKQAELADLSGFNHYLPLWAVVQNMFAFIHAILGLTFKRVANANVWHEQVELYDVWDEKNNSYVGQLYLDLISRNGKYSGASTFPLKPGFERTNGTREHATVALVTNFYKPAGNQPILLSHANLATLFHEMGHVLHMLLSRTKWTAFNGVHASRDFIECPSMLFEQLAWNKQVVQMIAEHYLTGESIPDDVVCGLDVAKENFIGLRYLREVTQAIYDLTVYSKPDVARVCRIYEQIEGNMALRNTSGVDVYSWHTVRKMVKGYDATLFVYLWGRAVSADMLYSRIYPEGVLNPDVWSEYRKTILQPGGACNIMDNVAKFLKRKPQNDAFFKLIGLY
ncbi:metalloendopeptidase [Coemansia sp. RSA 2336]|nr:metalloendopeptidase [Coemansia sp. RSA 2336]